MRRTPQLIGMRGVERVGAYQLLGQLLHFFPLPGLLSRIQLNAQQTCVQGRDLLGSGHCRQCARFIARMQSNLGVGQMRSEFCAMRHRLLKMPVQLW